MPLPIPLNVVGVSPIRWGRNLGVLLFLPLCAEMCRLDHIICVCIFPLPSAFLSPRVICRSGCGGGTVSRTAVMPCTTMRITDVDLLCLIDTRVTAVITRGHPAALLLPHASLLCRRDSVLTSAQSERLGPVRLAAKRGETRELLQHPRE